MKVSTVYLYDTFYLSHTSENDRILVRPSLNRKTSPNFGRVPSVPQWVVPPLECTYIGSSAGQMFQSRDELLNMWTVDWLSNSIHFSKDFYASPQCVGRVGRIRGSRYLWHIQTNI